MNKLEEQASAKAELSYSYWAKNEADEAPPPQPKKLSEAEAAAHQQQLKHTESGASAWNAAGTFEERPVPIGWVREQLEQVLAGVQHSPWHDAQPGRAAARVAALEVAACSGEAHQWIVRGRRRANFELQIELKWRVALDGVDVAGTAKLPHAASDELDELQLEVAADAQAAGGDEEGASAPAPTQEQRQAAVAAARGMLPQLEAALAQLLERVRAK